MSCTNVENKLEVCLPCAAVGPCTEVGACATLPQQFVNPGGDGFAGVPPVIPAVEPIVPIVCDTSYSSVITTHSIRSLYRTNSLLTNQRYYSRLFTITLVNGTPYTFTILSPSFSSYITLH